MTLMQRLQAEIAADPNPEPAQRLLQAASISAAARRNRVRIGLPEWPTARELAVWAEVESQRRGR